MSNKVKIAIMGFFLALSALLFLFSSGVLDSSSIDDFPEDGVNIDINSEAFIVNSDELLQSLGSVEALSNYSKDLFVFGDTAYENYINNKTDLIGFEITKLDSKDGEITTLGRFGSSENEIASTITLLKHNKLRVTITDKETGLKIDDFLPSNNKLQQFIGTLPVRGTNYEIDYFSDSDAFFINVFNTPNGNNEAETVIKTAVGEDVFNELEILRYGVGFGSGGSGFGL